MTRTRGATRAAADVRDAAAGAARTVFSRRAVPLWIAAAVVVALLAGFVIFGGLAPASRTPAQVPAGDEVRTSLYRIAVLDAELTDTVESQFLEAEPGETLLVLTVLLENLSDHAVGVERSADRAESRMIVGREPLLELSGITSTGTARSWRTDGSTRAMILQPGVAAEVSIAWPVADDEATAALDSGAARLDVHDAVEQSGQVILAASTITWRRAELQAQLDLEVTQ
ncbi:hypothetical protein [Microbacterium sp. SA39]|uniref:hypothetical protein n=1 Tax=Microbacterium sp. SA39 TaxID=1263625 RepID=UPI00061EA665|nr:hypothetical protein [Microbacterium sp. SA39]KJQ56123.1 hypothetical protein RS85_00027 [Microbacterium sp. SA39]